MSPQIQGTAPIQVNRQPGPNDKDDSTISSQPSVTSDAEASFAQPIAEDLDIQLYNTR